MTSAIFQLIVLAAIAIFLILRLRNVLGTREGFEAPREVPGATEPQKRQRPELSVIDGGTDRDIADHTDPDSDTGQALARMKRVEQDFNVTEFLSGAGAAYEMILMGYENAEMDDIRPYLSDEVAESFAAALNDRKENGLKVEANFVGLREVKLKGARYVDDTRLAEVSVRFVAELTSVVRDDAGEVVEGDPTQIKRQGDTWTFARNMGSDDPNWRLVATG